MLSLTGPEASKRTRWMSKESDRNDLLLYTREKYGWVHITHAAGSSLLSSAREACAGVGCV